MLVSQIFFTTAVHTQRWFFLEQNFQANLSEFTFQKAAQVFKLELWNFIISSFQKTLKSSWTNT